MTTDNDTVLEAKNVTKEFSVPGADLLRPKRIAAVDLVSVKLKEKPDIISLVGESGSGKTTLSRMLTGLTPPTDGKILFRGKDVTRLSRGERRDYLRSVQPIFQDPYSIYNPFYKIERALEMVVTNFKLASSKDEARALINESLKAVDLRPEDVFGRYPHQLSGGQCQRVMLARIFLIRPKVIIADEPVSMLDVAIRTLFLNILIDFRDKLGISCLFITHNLSTAYYVGGQMMVLCFGRVAESGDIGKIIEKPAHPYTQQLLHSIPSPDPEKRWTERAALEYVERPFTHEANKCAYVARCPMAMPICSQQRPPEYEISENHYAACFLHQGSPVHVSSD